jgi:hypothetical protein
MGRLTRRELVKARFKDTRDLVISETYNINGEFVGYSVSEQLVVVEHGKETRVFMRGGLGIVDRDGLKAIKQAIEKVLDESETVLNE